MSVQVKICGINHPDAAAAALKGGARFVGLVFFERSPRHVAPPLAAELSRMIPTGVRTVGLFVDPTNEYLEHVVSQVPLDLIQLHGDEFPARVAEIKAAFSMPVMKAIKVSSIEDLACRRCLCLRSLTGCCSMQNLPLRFRRSPAATAFRSTGRS